MYTLTGKKINKTYYTYLLISPITNKPFYVGKGQNTRYLNHFKEAINNKGSNRHKINTIKKIVASNLDVIIEIIHVSNKEDECFRKEIELIKQFGRRNNKTGVLTNLTDGGEGVSGADFSNRNQPDMDGVKNPMYGRHHTKETKEKISSVRKRKLANGEIIPKKHTEMHKQKLRENNPGGNATAKEIYQIDTKGIVIKKWPSARQAGIGVGLKVWRNVSICANHFKHRKSGGFYWRWAKDVGNLPLGTKINLPAPRNMKTYNLTLVSPDGSQHKLAKGLTKFCKEHGLCLSSFWQFLHGQTKSNNHKGWYILKKD